MTGVDRLRRQGVRRLLPPVSPWGLLWLTVVWVLLWGSLNVLNLLGGLLVALLVLVLFPLPRVDLHLRVRPLGLLVLLGRFLLDLVRASVEVAWLSVRPGPVATGVVMDLQLATDDPLLQTLTAEMVSLVPGSVVIELDPGNRVLTLHALNVRTRHQAEQVRHKVRAQEARVLRALHPDPASVLDPRRHRNGSRGEAPESTTTEETP
ncbi:Na+/H+ antiporter subunit E [uncultured Serinicoccus sp.]|uniref:Na+/H+ antiporter subunit E n=1 Tax=uncultured Serinicoccus sp. TaxID=735514 RepID=UPI00263646F0|nr:Na+/H+ antiporter subunit E [uncultured Serinicoccus sp.]